MTKKIRRTAAGAVAGAVVLASAACGVAESSGADELGDDPVTLRITWWGGDARHSRTQEALDLFEKKHPHITVEPEFSDWTGYWEKLATATAGGNSADVIQMDQLYLASYAARDSLADLEQLDQLDTSGLDPAVLDTGRAGGNLYAMPISTVVAGLLVNTDLIEELGAPLPDTSSWTWGEFEAWAQEVTEASPDGTYGTGLMTYEFTLQNFARQHGEELFDDETIVIPPETMSDFFQLALDWTTGGAAPPASTTAENTGLPLDQAPFSVGEAAAIFVPSTTITAYRAASGANLELVPFPTPDGGAAKYDYVKPGMYWSVSARSQHPAEAALLIDFLVNDTEAAEILGTERGIPANPATLDALRADLTPEETKAVDFTESRRPHVGAAPAIVPNGASDIDAVLQRYLQDVIFERQTPQDAADAFIAEMERSISAAS